MRDDSSEWLAFELKLLPRPEDLRLSLELAKTVWTSGDRGVEALGPFSVLGELSMLVRHATGRDRQSLSNLHSRYSSAVADAVREAGPNLKKAVLQELDYKIAVPEGILSDLDSLTDSEILEQYELYEIEDEFFHFLESAMYVITGIELMGLSLDLSGFRERLAAIREEWYEFAPRIARLFRESLQGERLRRMTLVPREFWWERILADATDQFR